MKKVLLLVASLGIFISCNQAEPKPGATDPLRSYLYIYSGEYINKAEVTIEERTYDPKNGDLQVQFGLRTSTPAGEFQNKLMAFNEVGKIHEFTHFDQQGYPYGKKTPLTPWCEKHIDDFSKIDLVEILTPEDVFLCFIYLHIKSLIIYSTNQEIAGRPIGADLSDLFCYVKHPKLYSYPDLSESIPDYKSDPEKLTLARLVELNMLPQVTSHFVLPVEMTKEERQTVNFKIEMVVEDDVLGERDLSAELTQ